MKTTTKQRNFLTLKEVKAKASHYYVYTKDKNVYKYRIEGEGYTLVENGIKLLENVASCYWNEEGVYEYLKNLDSDWVKVGF